MIAVFFDFYFFLIDQPKKISSKSLESVRLKINKRLSKVIHSSESNDINF